MGYTCDACVWQVLEEGELHRVLEGAAEANRDELLSTVDEAGRAGVGEYALVDPTPGTLVVFPSWLLHCVLPTCAEGATDHRISCAFNVTAEPVSAP